MSEVCYVPFKKQSFLKGASKWILHIKETSNHMFADTGDQ